MSVQRPLSLEVPPLHKRKRVPMRVIRALIAHIAEHFDPEEIILFGSYAYGKPEPWSDVDLLVIKEIPQGQQAEARRALWEIIPNHSFGLDILLRSREVIERRKALGDWFLREITSKGKVMYRRGDHRKGRAAKGQTGLDEPRTTLQPPNPKAQPLKEQPGINELAQEWLGIAESDLAQAELAMRAPAPILRGACFHSQQCAEKYLKAYMTEMQIEFPRRHPLVPLMELCIPIDTDFEALRSDLIRLEKYAVEVRYPGFDVTAEEAREALAAATRVRDFVRGKLGLACPLVIAKTPCGSCWKACTVGCRTRAAR